MLMGIYHCLSIFGLVSLYVVYLVCFDCVYLVSDVVCFLDPIIQCC